MSESRSTYVFPSKNEVNLFSCKDVHDIKRAVEKTICDKSTLLAKPKDSLILLKPNLVNFVSGLSGVTTDLRILAAVLAILSENGYKNVVIGEGAYPDIFRAKINVFSRLHVDRLAEKFGYSVCDLNLAPTREADLLGRKVNIPRICFERDFFINMPKLKTHTQTGLTICIKNLVGCLAGYDKLKLHLDIFEKQQRMFERMLKLNEILSPDLHIVDGLITMEGNGPGWGTPKQLDIIVSGTNPFLIDSLCARLVGFEFEEVPYLDLAIKKGCLALHDQEHLKTIPRRTNMQRPSRRLQAFTNVTLRNQFAALRVKWLGELFMHPAVSKLLISTGLRQPTTLKDISNLALVLDKDKCDQCAKCLHVCPVELPVCSETFTFDDSQCIKCLYCLFSCPKKAIRVREA